MARAVSLLEFMQEISSFVGFEPADMERASLSKKTTSNNKELKDNMKSWMSGDYDECPELLAQNLTFIARQ